MRARWMLIVVVAIVASCRWFGAERAPDASVTEGEHVLRTPEELRAEEIEKKVAALERRLPPAGDNATQMPDLAQATAPTLGPDIKPLPLPVPEPEPRPEVAPETVKAKPPTIEDVIVALEADEAKSPEQVFRLKALKALVSAASEQELLAKLQGTRDLKGFEQPWHDLAAALEATAQKRPDEALARMRAAESELVKVSSLRMGKPVFAKSILGFGNYQPLSSSIFAKGSGALVYFELADFVCRKTEGGWEYELAREVVVMDLAGRVAATLEDSSSVYTSQSCQRELFWPLRFNVPRDLYPGEYLLRVTVTDKLKKQVAEQKLGFEVR